MRKISIFTLSFLLLSFVSKPFEAFSQTGEWFEAPELKARIIAGSDNKAALDIQLADGWHTYWRVSGDTGLPPVLSWADSENIEEVEILWPAPQRKQEHMFQTFGYSDSVTLPLEVTRKATDNPTSLALKGQVMICSDICIPQAIELSLNLSDEDHSAEDTIISAAQEGVPKAKIEGLSIDSMVAAKNALVISVSSDQGFDGLDVFPVIEEDKIGLANTPSIEVSEFDPNKALVKIEAPLDLENLAAAFQEKTLSVIVTHEGRALKHSVQY